MKTSKSAPITVDPQDGEILGIAGGNYRILISGKQTNGAFSVIDMLIPPQNGPGPHSHANFYESFYVVDGEVEVYSEAGSYAARKGSFVLIPKGGIIHYFKNVSEQTAHLMCTVVPAGLEDFFAEIGQPVSAGEFPSAPPAMNAESLKKLESIANKHGQTLYPPGTI